MDVEGLLKVSWFECAVCWLMEDMGLFDWILVKVVDGFVFRWMMFFGCGL